MMHDEEFRKFLHELRSAYGFPPVASSQDTVDSEDFIVEDDHLSLSPSYGERWQQAD